MFRITTKSHLKRLATTTGLPNKSVRLLSAGKNWNDEAATASPPAQEVWSSTDIADAVAKIRETIIIPGRLNKAQKNVVFKPKYIKRLENDPIYINVDGQEHRLRHIQKTSDVPRAWRSLNHLILQVNGKRDHENLLKLVKDFKRSGFELKDAWFCKIARYMIARTFLPQLMRALREVGTTGMSLKNAELLAIVLHGIRSEAVRSDWSLDETTQSLLYAEQVMTMLEDPSHCGGHQIQSNDARTAPEVFAVAVELLAVLVYKHNYSPDEKSKLSVYIGRLSSMLQAHNVPENIPTDISDDLPKMMSFMKLWIPVYHALALFVKIGGVEDAEAIRVQPLADSILQPLLKAKDLTMQLLSQEAMKGMPAQKAFDRLWQSVLV